jgi:tetratricopeptide (TPR) repeat protein
MGWWHLQNHRWPQAEARWQAVAFGPDEGGSLLPGRDLAWFYLSYAPLLIEVDQTNRYEQLRLSALRTFGDTGDTLNAIRILTVCLLRPPPAAIAAKLDKLAETVARRDPRQTNWTGVADSALALLACRRGEYEQAMKWIEKDADLSNPGLAMVARYRVLAALAWSGLGQRDKARGELAAWAERIEKNFNTSLPSGKGIHSEGWHTWSIDHLLLLEAKSLLEAAPNAESKEIGDKRG